VCCTEGQEDGAKQIELYGACSKTVGIGNFGAVVFFMGFHLFFVEGAGSSWCHVLLGKALAVSLRQHQSRPAVPCACNISEMGTAC